MPEIMKSLKIDRVLIDTTIAHFVNDGLSYLPYYLIVLIKEGYKLTFFQNSLILMVYYLGGAVISPIMGRYIDNVKKKGFMMGIGLFLFSISFILLAIPYPKGLSIYCFMAGMFVISIFSTIYHPIGSMILNRKYRENAGTALGINGIGGGIGRAVFPGIFLLFNGIFKDFSISLIFLTIIMAILGLYVALDLRKEEFFVEQKKKNSLFKFSLPITILLIATILRTMAISGGSAMLPSYMNITLGFNSTIVGIIVVLAYTSAIFGQPFLGYLSDKFSRTLILILTSALYGILIIILMFLQNILTVSIVYILSYFVGLSNFPLLMALVGKISKDSDLAENSAIIFGLGGGIGGALGTFLIGFMGQVINTHISFIIMGIVSIVSAIIILFIPLNKK
ncbi:MAG: MFS transporter [Thermoplasmata archaeon]|nr:MFS transporter [Thermoplasmata archaeon]